MKKLLPILALLLAVAFFAKRRSAILGQTV